MESNPATTQGPRAIPRLGWLVASVVGILALAVVSCCALPGMAGGLVGPISPAAPAGTPEATQALAQSFAVGVRPTLVIHDAAGNVRLKPGPDGKVAVTATKRVRGLSDADARRILGEMGVEMTQNANTITVAAHFPSDAAASPGATPGAGASGSLSVDIDLTVPVASQITADVGTGNVTIQQIAGQMNVSTTVGDITAQNAVFAGASHFTATTGDIMLDGEMNSASLLEAQVTTGSITMWMPAVISAHLDARTDDGSISVKGWSVPISQQGASGAQAVADLRPGPTDFITLRVTTGNITFAAR